MTRVAMKLPMIRPMVGIKLQSSRGQGSESGDGSRPGSRPGGVQWLMDLKAKVAEEREAHQATMRCIGKLIEAVDPIPALIQSRLDEIGGMVTEMALAVAREIVGEALDRGLVDPTPTVQRCLRDCVQGSGDGSLAVELAPGDLGHVLAMLQGKDANREALSNVVFRGDPSLHRGEVVVRAGAGMLHYDPVEVFERLCEAVRQEVQR